MIDRHVRERGGSFDPVNPVSDGVSAALREFRELLSARFADRLVDVRLFGSHARGDWTADSDIDVLVVIAAQTEAERREVFDFAWDVYTRNLLHISPLALSDAEWNDLKSRELLIARDIEAEGIRL